MRNLVDTSTARQPNPATVLSMFARIILLTSQNITTKLTQLLLPVQGQKLTL